MLRKIINIQDEGGMIALSHKSKRVGCESDLWLNKLVDDLIDTARACVNPTCAGLTANQIGEPVQVMVIQWGAEYLPIINPVVVDKSEKTCPYREPCLSMLKGPGVWTKRHKTITLDYLDHSPEQIVRRKFKSRDAIVVQHCLDHFEGRLI